MKLFSHEMAQQQWASVDYRKNMSMIGLVRIGGHQEIIAIGSYADESDTQAEVAFVVREDFQGLGIASYLLAGLERIAKENHFKSFSATVLRENTAMLHVFKKRYPHAKTSVSGGSDVTMHMDFDDAVEPGDATKKNASDTDACACPKPACS
jgi:GNAT superfamily N-acetyltransferase